MDRAEVYCGGDDIFLNGQQLVTSFSDESHAYGSGFLYLDDSSSQIYASWQITCLAGGVDTTNVDGVQVLTLRFENQDRPSGFTISYQAFTYPQILQFDPHPNDLDAIERNGLFWRTPSEISRDVSTSNWNDVKKKKKSESANSRQKSLSFHSLGDLIGAEVEAVKNVAKKAMVSCRHHFPGFHSMLNNLSQNIFTFFCPRRQGSPHALQEFMTGSAKAPPDSTPKPLDELKAPPSPEKLSPTYHESLDTTNSLALSETYASPLDAPHDLEIPTSFSDEQDQGSRHFKALGLAVVLITLFVYIYKWLTDPRRRADRAARREERRRRCLYRRAARIQKFRNCLDARIQNFRYCLDVVRRQFYPLPLIVYDWDEKQVRVQEQEEILETVMKDEIRTLRQAHGVEDNIGAAEEGRNRYIYDTDSSRSERRRSMTTLPGYESEGTQPPGYESDVVSVSDAFLYTPAESEDTPDSSVISTSPRISRDGRDSDFEKETLSDWTLESRPLYGFRSVDIWQAWENGKGW